MVANRAFLFVGHSLRIGGVQTLLVRMASAVAELGYHTTVAAPHGDMAVSLPPPVHHLPLDSRHGAAVQIERSYVPPDGVNSIDIWTSRPVLNLDIYRLQKSLWRTRRIRTRAVTGVFRSDEWTVFPEPSLRNMVARTLHRATPVGSIYFVNDSTRRAVAKRWGDRLLQWPVRLLALDGPNATWSPPARSSRLRVVSVGRLTPFKAYNFGAIEAIRRLHANGVDVIWDIWGDGEERERLEVAIAAAGMGDRLALRGNIPYAEIAGRMADYDIFVGMGTAALEAAQIHMPAVISVFDSADDTYGLLAEAPLDSVGERVDGAATQPLWEVLARYASMSDAERVSLGQGCSAAVAGRAGEELPPFDAMFAGGVSYPDSLHRNAGHALLSVLRRLRRRGL